MATPSAKRSNTADTIVAPTTAMSTAGSRLNWGGGGGAVALLDRVARSCAVPLRWDQIAWRSSSNAAATRRRGAASFASS